MPADPVIFTDEQARRIWQAVMRVESMSASGGTLRKSGASMSLYMPQAKSGGAARMMQVQSEGDDHIVCREWDGATLGPIDIFVAKPPLMRKAVYDGTTNASGWLLTYVDSHTRTATKDGEDAVSHVIDPPYAQGDIIYADQPDNGTGVEYSGLPVVWCDSNRDARAFTAECA